MPVSMGLRCSRSLWRLCWLLSLTGLPRLRLSGQDGGSPSERVELDRFSLSLTDFTVSAQFLLVRGAVREGDDGLALLFLLRAVTAPSPRVIEAVAAPAPRR